MKSKKTKIIAIAAAAVILIAVLVPMIGGMIRDGRVKTLVNQQNYVASKLIELGDYVQGWQLAARSDQTLENAVSRQLMVLATGFQADFDAVITWADAYLADGSDAVIAEVRTIASDIVEKYREQYGESSSYGWGDSYVYYDLDEDTRADLLKILLRVQASIDVKKNGTGLQAMVDMLQNGGYGDSITEQALNDDTSALALKLKALTKMKQHDYDGAYELAEQLFTQDDSFENRALLANLVASGGVYSPNEEVSAATAKRMDRRSDLYEKLGKLQTDLADEESERKQIRLQQEIASIEAEIDAIDTELEAEPVRRAINFIELQTPVADKNSGAYQMEMAYLYHAAGEKNKADDMLVDLLDHAGKSTEPVAMTVKRLADSYQKDGAGSSNTYRLEQLWQSVMQLLHITDIRREYNEESFFEYLLDLLDRMFNGVLIRHIDTTGFPKVRVTVTIAAELEEKLKKSDFEIYDMDNRIRSVKLIEADKAEVADQLSVMLVVDRSGSMQGTSMENTKAAVTNFVRSVDAKTNLGLVTFESVAELMTPLGSSRLELLRDIEGLTTTGGTSIYSGLQTAGEALAGRSGRKVIILLSDGADGDSGMIDGVLADLKTKNIAVYTIGIPGADTTYLKYIADSCGGKYMEADSSELLHDVYQTIGDYVENDYILEFEAKSDLEEFTRSLRVKADAIDAASDRDYTVGVPAELLAEEENSPALFDCFRQIGGSVTE